MELLEVGRRAITKRRVEPAGVVEALDDAEDFAPGLGHRPESPPVEQRSAPWKRAMWTPGPET